MKIVRKGQTSRDVSPLFTHQTSNRKETEDQCFKFLEANELQKSMEHERDSGNQNGSKTRVGIFGKTSFHRNNRKENDACSKGP